LKPNIGILGCGWLGFALAKKMISLNQDGSFSITQIAKEILWSNNVPSWAKILRLLQIKSCSMSEIIDVLKISEDVFLEDIEKLRKNQLVLMSPQRHDEKLVKTYEILPEGIEEIDRTETEGFDKINFEESKPGIEILSLIDEITKEIQDSVLESERKNSITEKLFKLKERLEI